MEELSNWSRTTWIVVGALLVIAVLGWGFALDRDRKLDEHASQITVLEGEQSALGQRFAELETTLADERQAAGDLAALNEQLTAAQAELETVEATKGEAEAAVEAAQGKVAEAEQHVADLTDQASQAEERLAGVTQEIGTAEATLAERSEEVTRSETALARVGELEALGDRTLGRCRRLGKPPCFPERGGGQRREHAGGTPVGT